MRETDYAYAVSRIRAQELKLLARQDLEQLIACPTESECLRLLADKGWNAEGGNVSAMLQEEEDKTWALLRELAPDASVFDVFLIQNDYQNLKAAVKAVLVRTDCARYLVAAGRVQPEVIRQAAETGDFSALPAAMQAPAAKARETLLHTGDGQLADIILDQATLTELLEAGRTAGDWFARYAETVAATTNIKIAARAQRAGKQADFYQRALAPCGTLNVQELAAAAQQGEQALLDYLAGTPYAKGAELLKTSFPAFERWCDDQVMEQILPAKTQPFGPEPLAGYLLARETEIRAVRIILSAKHNSMPEEIVRERLREMYV